MMAVGGISSLRPGQGQCVDRVSIYLSVCLCVCPVSIYHCCHLQSPDTEIILDFSLLSFFSVLVTSFSKGLIQIGIDLLV